MENNETKIYTDYLFDKVGKLEKEAEDLEHSKNYDLIFNSAMLFKEYLLFFEENLLDDALYDENDRRYLIYKSFVMIQGDLIEADINIGSERGMDLTYLIRGNGDILSRMSMIDVIRDDDDYNRYEYLEKIDPNEDDLAKVQGR